MEKLTATNLKNSLWETLNDVKEGKKGYADADAIATQAREILRTVNTQIKVAAFANRQIPAEVISFSESA
jgi:hypothetical protein